MKTSLTAIGAALLLCGCAEFSPAVSKTNLGNLEVNVVAPEGLNVQDARLYIDEVFVGNTSSRMPVLQLKRGKRLVKVELNGAETFSEAITILGQPNHQLLNVVLKPKHS